MKVGGPPIQLITLRAGATQLLLGPPVGVGVQGQSVVIINDPTLLDSASLPVLAFGSNVSGEPQRPLVARNVLIRFDAQPTIDAFDAQVLPHQVARIPVPPGAQTLFLVAGRAVEIGWFTPATPPTEVGIGWGDEIGFPDFRPTRPSLLVGGNPTGVNYILGDNWGNAFTGLVPDAIYDRSVRGGWPHVRPRSAPNVSDTVVIAATGINTLFSMAGPRAVLTVAGVSASNPPTPLRTLDRIIVSVGAACLLVIGGSSLTVASPGVNEIARLRFPAAGIQVIEFGGAAIEGLDGGAGPGNWQAYTSVSTTFDAMIVGG